MPKVTKDVTLWMTFVLHEMLTRVIMAKENHPRVYWILLKFEDGYEGPPLVCSNNLINQGTKILTDLLNSNDRVFRTIDFSTKHVNHNTLICLEEWHLPPVPLINSALWRIDNKIGEARCIYILPPDKPIMWGTEMGESSKFIWKSARGAPLVWSTN